MDGENDFNILAGYLFNRYQNSCKVAVIKQSIFIEHGENRVEVCRHYNKHADTSYYFVSSEIARTSADIKGINALPVVEAVINQLLFL